VIIWVAYHFGFTMAVIASKVAALVALIAYFRVVSRFNSLLWPAMSIVAVCVIYIAIVFNNYS
jgi:hypothetical protein